jgi:hypothetical protein
MTKKPIPQLQHSSIRFSKASRSAARPDIRRLLCRILDRCITVLNFRKQKFRTVMQHSVEVNGTVVEEQRQERCRTRIGF